MKDDWTPRLSADGRTYCSPRCGMKCTKAEHDAAQRDAAALAARLGPGWEPRVWENCGWYWEVANGAMTVKPPRHDLGKFAAWFEPSIVVAGTSLQIIVEADTPEDAVGFAVQDARGVVARIEQSLAAINGDAA